MAVNTTPQAPLFTKRALFTLIWPLLLEQTLSVTMGMADTLMVAGVGEAAVSSVSLVDTLNVLIIQILSALATGGAVIASQYLGRRDTENACRSAAQLYSVLGISTVVVGIVCMLLSRPILRGVFGSIDEDVMRFAQQYFLISAVSYPFIGLYNGGAALFRAQGNSRISMLASLVMNVINIAGNALLIYGFGMGVIGAALATLIGRVFAAVFILWQNQNLSNPLRVQELADLKPRSQPIRQILSLGIPSGLENGMFQIGKLCVSSLTSTLGTSAIAANAVANSVSTLANIPGNTMSLAMIPVIGQCLGAGDKKQAKHYSVTLLGIAISGLAIANALVFVLMPEIVTWFNLSAEASVLCTTVVHMFNVASVFFWATSFTLPNALRAGGDAKYTMTVSIISMWLFRVILSYVFVLQFQLGLAGVWLGMFCDWVFRSICFLIRFVRGKWMNHKVI
ncbi:MATE family efflux transporter [Gemmiger formicilis]|uniref:MATE family efflux transporter n=1 Tax=Gemmiger formicilis TaxID=745368 RepID=UPI00210BED6E|nr:MATE family efflux transporter [Gemmiger formicilis]MCQ5079926.1 MATE family efflux transporter [Gemmiger formicilis]MCQ5116708.1 MATE family efflux transporter [Gemmiger formicilis]